MFRFEQARIDSKDILLKLWIDTFTQAFKMEHSAENIRYYCDRYFTSDFADKVLTSNEYVSVIGYEKDFPAGFYIVKHLECPFELEGSSSELKQIYILSQAYGSGLGQLLFNHSANLLSELGKKQMWLCVSDKNLRAQSFYNKLGFKNAGTGPTLEVGSDSLSSSILTLNLKDYQNHQFHQKMAE